MAKERKKAEKEIIPEVEAKKRTEIDKPKPMVIEIETKTEKLKTGETKPKRSECTYIRIAMGASMEERKEITDRVAKNELKLSHYAMDNEIGYHYYEVLKK